MDADLRVAMFSSPVADYFFDWLRTAPDIAEGRARILALGREAVRLGDDDAAEAARAVYWYVRLRARIRSAPAPETDSSRRIRYERHH